MKRNDRLFRQCSLFEHLTKIAGLVEDLKLKHPNLSDKIDYFVQRDSTRKYLQYEVKVLAAGQALETEIADVIELFHKFKERLEKKDINAYPFTELRDKLFELRRDSGTKSRRQEIKDIKTSGAQKLYEDDQCELLYVSNKASACFYGKGTKWCITMENASYFEDYQGKNVVFYYVLRKDLDPGDVKYKVAISVQRNKDNQYMKDAQGKDIGNQFWLSDDTQVFSDQAFIGLRSKDTVLNIIKQDAPQRPMGFLAKLHFKPEELTTEDYVKNMNYDNKYIIAKVTNDPKILTFLSRDKNFEVLREVADNINCPSEILRQLADNPDPYVQVNIARNANTPPDILLALLMTHEQEGPRSRIISTIAANPNAPIEAFQKLEQKIKDPEGIHIRRALSNNISTPSNILIQLSEDADEKVKENVAANPSTPINILEHLATKYETKYYVMKNPSFPDDLRAKFFHSF